MRLWKNLRPNTPLKDRKSMEWVDIGFQGKDPATDFRGAGTLGLQQLLAITDENSKYRKEALRMYRDSINVKHWYFFAASGLNIT